MKNKQTENLNLNFNMLSFLQYFFSLVVIAFHCEPFFHNEIVHFFQKSIISRMAVPFFIVCSAYMVQRKSAENPLYRKKYMQKMVRNYLLLSLLYLPYGLSYFAQLHIAGYYLPIALLVALFYTGMCYHLWYIPALLQGFFLVQKLRKRFSFVTLCFLSCLLYLFGSIETYINYLNNPYIQVFYAKYTQIFFTTRNGLFYVPIFICIGYALYKWRSSAFLANKSGTLFLVSIILLASEGFLLFQKQGIDHNFLLTLPLFIFALFNGVIRTPIGQHWTIQKLHLKDYSIFYYFLHPAIIEILSLPFLTHHFFFTLSAWQRFILVLLLTHFVSTLVICYCQTKNKG